MFKLNKLYYFESLKIIPCEYLGQFISRNEVILTFKDIAYSNLDQFANIEGREIPKEHWFLEYEMVSLKEISIRDLPMYMYLAHKTDLFEKYMRGNNVSLY